MTARLATDTLRDPLSATDGPALISCDRGPEFLEGYVEEQRAQLGNFLKGVNIGSGDPAEVLKLVESAQNTLPMFKPQAYAVLIVKGLILQTLHRDTTEQLAAEYPYFAQIRRHAKAPPGQSNDIQLRNHNFPDVESDKNIDRRRKMLLYLSDLDSLLRGESLIKLGFKNPRRCVCVKDLDFFFENVLQAASQQTDAQ